MESVQTPEKFPKSPSSDRLKLAGNFWPRKSLFGPLLGGVCSLLEPTEFRQLAWGLKNRFKYDDKRQKKIDEIFLLFLKLRLHTIVSMKKVGLCFSAN